MLAAPNLRHLTTNFRLQGTLDTSTKHVRLITKYHQQCAVHAHRSITGKAHLHGALMVQHDITEKKHHRPTAPLCRPDICSISSTAGKHCEKFALSIICDLAATLSPLPATCLKIKTPKFCMAQNVRHCNHEMPGTAHHVAITNLVITLHDVFDVITKLVITAHHHATVRLHPAKREHL